jgi:hypothetical protein
MYILQWPRIKKKCHKIPLWDYNMVDFDDGKLYIQTNIGKYNLAVYESRVNTE